MSLGNELVGMVVLDLEGVAGGDFCVSETPASATRAASLSTMETVTSPSPTRTSSTDSTNPLPVAVRRQSLFLGFMASASLPLSHAANVWWSIAAAKCLDSASLDVNSMVILTRPPEPAAEESQIFGDLRGAKRVSREDLLADFDISDAEGAMRDVVGQGGNSARSGDAGARPG